MPVYNFGETLVRVMAAARQEQRQQQQDAQQQEDRKIEREMLKHRLAQMKVEENLKMWSAKREAQIQNINLTSGQPEASYPESAFAQPAALPSADRSQAVAGYPGGPQQGVSVDAQQILPRTLRPVTLPGNEDLGVGDVQVTPKTLQEQIAARIAEARLKDALAPPKYTNVPRGGTLINEKTGKVVARGEPVPDTSGAADARQQRGIDAVNERLDRTEEQTNSARRTAALTRKNVALSELEKERRPRRTSAGEAVAPIADDLYAAEKQRIGAAYADEIATIPAKPPSLEDKARQALQQNGMDSSDAAVKTFLSKPKNRQALGGR